MTHRLQPIALCLSGVLFILSWGGCVTNDVPAAPALDAGTSPMDAGEVLDVPEDVPDTPLDMGFDMRDEGREEMPDLSGMLDLGAQDMMRDLGEQDLPDAMPDLGEQEEMGPCAGECSEREECVSGSCVDVCDVQGAQCGEVMHAGSPRSCGECAGIEQGCIANQCVDLCAESGAQCGDVRWSGDIASCGACMGLDEVCTDTQCQTGGRWATVTTGRAHTCALTQSGKVWCWGDNEQGQLGHPQTAQRALVPVETSNLGTILLLDTTDQHTCAVDTSNLAWCWGDNTHGQIGNGQQLDRNSPYRITSLSNVAQVTTGSWHTCARSSDQSVRCVGYGQQGQVGDGSTNNSTAFRIARNLSEGAVYLDAGPAHTCTTTRDGAIKCWGYNGVSNAYGRLGVGDTRSRVEPTAVASVGWAVQVASGEEHSCAVNQNGEVWCWGDNTFGQLGDGSSSDKLSPHKIAGLSDVRRVTAGEAHSCAVTHSGELYCWGRNDAGQLGIGSLNVQRTPQRVAISGEVLAAQAGYRHTCAVTREGSLYCWGDNASGQLGLGDLTARLSPELVP